MTNLNTPESKVHSAICLVEANESSNIRLNANGGNSILLVCEPHREQEYIHIIKTLMDPDKYELIDLNAILCDFVTTNRHNLDESFELLKGSIPQIFMLPAGEQGADFFGLILQAIERSLNTDKIPVLLRTGTLYGSGIDNIHIMENEIIMKASLPLIILYPAVRDKDKLMFLGSRPASNYRCVIIE
ncbi:MAG: hypothetical protein ACMUJM_24950 [bacterium]